VGLLEDNLTPMSLRPEVCHYNICQKPVHRSIGTNPDIREDSPPPVVVPQRNPGGSQCWEPQLLQGVVTLEQVVLGPQSQH
jgi:hypothetical protein